MDKNLERKLAELNEKYKLKLNVEEKKEESVEVNYPIPGRIYKHYKGGLYRVNHLEKHTETDEILVSYTSLTFGTHFARPLSVWNKKVSKFGLRYLLQN